MLNSHETRSISSLFSSWLQRGSPILTVALLIAIELLDKTLFKIPNPTLIYLTAVVYAAFSGGLRCGLISAGITLLYAVYYFSTSGQLFHYTDDNLWRVIILAVTTPAIATMVGILKRQVEQLACEADGRLTRISSLM